MSAVNELHPKAMRTIQIQTYNGLAIGLQLLGY